MSSIVLSSAVRQNLLALQSTASMMASTQNDLATGKKVNSALDNPTNFFTAAGLDNRAGDISNLLDGISNGVQVLQAANTGITSLESLVGQAKSVANQALQTSIGYSQKASVTSTTISGATADNLTGNSTTVTTSTGTALALNDPNINLSTKLTAIPLDNTDDLEINGTDITFTDTSGSTSGNNLDLSVATVGDLLNSIIAITGQPLNDGVSSAGAFLINGGATISANNSNTLNKLGLSGGSPGSPLTAYDLTSTTFAKLGITAGQGISIGSTTYTFVSGASSGNNISINSSPASLFNQGGLDQLHYYNSSGSPVTVQDAGTPGALETLGFSGTNTVASNATLSSSNSLPPIVVTGSNWAADLGINSSDTLVVNGHTIAFNGSGVNSVTSTGATLNLAWTTVSQVLTAVDTITGGTSSIDASGHLTINAASSGSLTTSGSALSKLGLSPVTSSSSGISGQTLSFASVGGGTATTITFGDGTNGTVKSLDQLNTQLAADNLQATLDAAGKLTITTTNDAASASIGTIGGTAFSSTSGAFYNKTASAPVADAASQATRSTLISQYNAILTQIDNTAADSSYNGVNLLNGDQLQLTFNETGKSKLNITGVNFSSAGLGLSSLVSGTDFIDNSATNKVLTTLNTVSSTLRSQASALGSNLSVVQTRQSFNTNLIDVLQTGSSNLTQADINLEAANSQALSTRQSLSVSALSLANQSQQSVLQLLR